MIPATIASVVIRFLLLRKGFLRKRNTWLGHVASR
jgi:hypothetical protein